MSVKNIPGVRFFDRWPSRQENIRGFVAYKILDGSDQAMFLGDHFLGNYMPELPFKISEVKVYPQTGCSAITAYVHPVSGDSRWTGYCMVSAIHDTEAEAQKEINEVLEVYIEHLMMAKADLTKKITRAANQLFA